MNFISIEGDAPPSLGIATWGGYVQISNCHIDMVWRNPDDGQLHIHLREENRLARQGGTVYLVISPTDAAQLAKQITQALLAV